MRLHLIRIIVACLAFVPISELSFATGLQPGRVVVSLQINHQAEQNAVVAWIDFDSADAGNRMSGIPGLRTGTAPGGVLAGLQQMKQPQYAYRIWIDSNADGRLADDEAHMILPDSAVDVMVSRTWRQKNNLLPYTITYSRIPNEKSGVREVFYWRPKYRVEGELRINQCKALLVVLDINGDGVFDARDSERGTTIGLDRNGDGRVWGAGEWLQAHQIIEYCGTSMLIDNFELDGSAVTLVETKLRVPKIGDLVPSFSLFTIRGKTINLNDLRGKPVLLDFWASWCKPCVAQFGNLKRIHKRHRGKIEVISVNVDEPSRVQMASQIVRDHKLAWPQVMTGQGSADPIWKTFGGIEGNRLAIPLYVLVDQQGRLRYAGAGGESLSDLGKKIVGLLESVDSR